MTAKYIQPGNAIRFQNTGDTDILACEAVPLGARIAIAGDTIKAGEMGTLMLTGIWEMETDGSVFAVGDPVYYDDAAGKVTATKGDIQAGVATASAAADDTVVCVKIG